jgi:hypothetical protein
MNVSLHPDVQRVAEYMQREISADRLVSVAQSLAAVAPLLWSCYHATDQELPILRLSEPSIASLAVGDD